MNKPVTKPAKGMRDFLPHELVRRSYVMGVIREVYERYGFAPLETPSIERIETLLGKYGDEGDQLVFKVLRRGQPLVEGIRNAAEHIADESQLVRGRSGETAPGAETLLADMGLRYDLTVPLARVMAEYRGKLPQQFRRYQIQPVWRADTPGKGRFREFYQCDVDVLGSKELVAEVEVLSAVVDALETLGFDDFEVRVNHRQLIRAFVEVAAIPLDKEGEAIVAVDKLDKVGRDGVAKELEAKGIQGEAQATLLALTLDGLGIDALKERLASHEGGQQALLDLETLFALAKHTPAGPRLTFNASLARGLGYYTGSIFEVVSSTFSGSLGGGGRYDGLVGMFGSEEIPACGFSIGLERILVLMEQNSMFGEVAASPVLVACDRGEACWEKALQLCAALRSAGISASLLPAVQKPAKVKKRALSDGVSALVFVSNADALKLVRPDTDDRELSLEDLVSELSGAPS